MKRFLQMKAAVPLLCGIALSLSAAPAREGRERPAWDAAKHVTVTGNVTAVEEGREGPARGTKPEGDRPERGKAGNRAGQRGPGSLVIRLKSGTSEYLVMTGPAHWLKEQGFAFKTGDTLTVVGMRHDRGERAVLAAARITRNGKTLVLRDNSGEPQWPRPERRGGGNR